MTVKTSKHVAATIAAGLTALWAQHATAQTTYQIGGETYLEQGFNLSMDVGTPSAHVDNDALVGGIILTPVNPAGPSIVSVCTDVEGTVYIGSDYNYAAKTFAQAPASGIDPIWGADNAGKTYTGGYDAASAKAAIQNAAYLFSLYGHILGTSSTLGAGYTGTSVQQQAALQLAVWASLYNTAAAGSQSITVNGTEPTYRFSATGDATAIADANTMLQSLTATGRRQFSGSLLIAVDGSGNPVPGVQEMLLTPTPVPEPTTVLAGALLLLPFGVSTLRFARKKAAV